MRLTLTAFEHFQFHVENTEVLERFSSQRVRVLVRIGYKLEIRVSAHITFLSCLAFVTCTDRCKRFQRILVTVEN